ncbi:MAG TPA: hypothetical protein VJI33_02640 [Candidatus Paceibacterota bacterium]
MKTEQALYTEIQVQEIVEKAIQQDRELLAQTLRGMPCGAPKETKQWWIENPKAVTQTLKIFNTLPGPQHLYEFRIRKDGALAATLVTRTRETFYVSEYAEAMTNNAKEFAVGPKEEVIIRVFTCETLGVSGWSETDFFGPKGFEHVKKFGLRECLPDDAFAIRAAHKGQPLDEWIRVAHKPISADGYSLVFGVGPHRDDGLYVDSYCLGSCYRLNPDFLVALRVASSQN